MHRPWRVLFVDDDADLREVCSEILIAAGYDVLQAKNGSQAIDIATRRLPDVVIMDLDMPVMGGLEAIRRLRRDPRTSALPIVVLSASSAADHASAAALGCNTCLSKPCTFEDLELVVRSMAESRGLEPAPRSSSFG